MKFKEMFVAQIILVLMFSTQPVLAEHEIYPQYGMLLYGIESTKSNHHPNTSGEVYAFMPFAQYADKSAWWFDQRLKFDLSSDSSHHELNLGLVYRRLYGQYHDQAYGLYGFFDTTHLQDGYYFNQYTFGFEKLSLTSYFNFNAYLASDSFQMAFKSTVSSPVFAIGEHFYITDQTGEVATVKALSGADLTLEKIFVRLHQQDLGWQLAYKCLEKQNFLTVNGPKISLFTDRFQFKSKQRLEVFASYDDFFGSSVGVTLSQTFYNTKRRDIVSSYWLSHPVIRDLDIQLAYLPYQKTTTKQSPKNPAFNFLRSNQEILDSIFSIYVINLDRDIERLSDFQVMMEKNSLTFQRLPAVDGYDLDKKSLQSQGLISDRAHDKLRRGEIACALSHKKLWQQQKNQFQPYVMVFEDDVKLPDDFRDKLIGLTRYIDEYAFDVLLLGRTTWAERLCENKFGWQHHGCIALPKPLLDPNPLIRPPFSWGAFAYVVPKTRLPNLLKAYEVLDRPMDTQWWDPAYQLQIMSTNPLWLDQYQTALRDSHSFKIR